QHDLLTQGLGVNHLRLVMGTSMGCMHSWVWGETYPDFMDALMPLACLPVEIAGRNRMFRKMLMDSIRNDPNWQNGDYTTEPQEGLIAAEHILILAGSAPLQMQKQAPTREAAEKLLAERVEGALRTADANDMLYQFDASRNYNPEPQLEKIRVPVMAVNSADDFINPPELGIMEREIKRVPKGKYVLIAISDQTRGHGTHTIANVWKQYLAELLQGSGGGVGHNSQLPAVPQPPQVDRSNGTGRSEDFGSGKPDRLGACNTITAPEVGPVYVVGPGITSPRVIYSPNPEFPEEMRREKKQGEAK